MVREGSVRMSVLKISGSPIRVQGFRGLGFRVV